MERLSARILASLAIVALAVACFAIRASGPAAAHEPFAPDPTVAPEAQTEIDKCETLRAAAQDIVGTLIAATRRATSLIQDMPTLSCEYRAENGWLTVMFVMGQDRAQFERLAALVPDIKRLDGIAEVAFAVPPTPQQRPAGATVSLWHAGTLVTVEAASAKTADQLGADVAKLARTITGDDRLLHGHDKQGPENQHLQGGG